MCSHVYFLLALTAPNLILRLIPLYTDNRAIKVVLVNNQFWFA